jgi:hypothetical protein
MDTKHTPGPWEVRCGQETNRPRAIVAPNDTGPGGVGSIVRWNGIGFPSSPAAQANARLIAAAPDMFMALLDLQVIAEQHITDLAAEVQEGRSADAVWRMEMARWQAVIDAFQKATGETA